MQRRIILDVSNNRTISGAQLTTAKPLALICKATEGAGPMIIGGKAYPLDPTYDNHRRLAHEHGIPFGAYLFLHPGSRGNEAEWFLNHARPVKGDIQPIIDVEIRDGMSFEAVAARAESCALALESHGYRPLLYSYTSFLQALYAYRPELTRLRVWQAAYTPRRPVLGHGASVVLWQYTDRFPISGFGYDASKLFVKLPTLLID